MSDANWKSASLVDALKERLTGEEERAGFVLTSGEIIELQNFAEDRTNSFEPDDFEVLEHIDKDIAAIWHTHPNSSANLSSDDWVTFTSWPGIEHIIIGTDGVRFYGTHGVGVVNLPSPEVTQ